MLIKTKIGEKLRMTQGCPKIDIFFTLSTFYSQLAWSEIKEEFLFKRWKSLLCIYFVNQIIWMIFKFLYFLGGFDKVMKILEEKKMDEK